MIRLPIRLAISAVPLGLALLVKLLSMAVQDQRHLQRLPDTFFDISSDLILSSFGILLGVLFLSAKAHLSLKEMKEIGAGFAVVFVSLLICQFFSLVVPAAHWEWANQYEFFWSIMVPDLVGLFALGLAVKVGT
jgi:hypothetical protein